MDKTIGAACNITTGKLDANQAIAGGKYPFFTCAQSPDQIDHFAYDDDVVLVAGNNANGNFHVTRFRGKFNAYQRTYILTAKPGYNIDFIYCALKLELKRLRERSQGSQTKFLTMPILTGIQLRDINEEDQSDIASVLTSIDKKIELNNRINAELEAMAKTLYNYWFVQFDFPEADGKPYKTSGGKMEYNAILKREIPAGWDAKKIGDITLVKAGGDKPSEFSEVKTNKNMIPIYSNGVTDDGLYGYTNQAIIDQPSITISARGTIGFSVLRMKPFVPIIRLIVLTPFVKTDLKFLHETIKWIGFENSGSVQQQLTVPQISSLYVPYPPSEYRKKYADVVASSVIKIELIKEQNEELKRLRDWLLPMLMNGQVTVK
jgi:type I restriction enzyme, S subunit